MFTILLEIDRKTSQYPFLIVREAISSVLKRHKNAQLRKKEVWDKCLKNAL